MAGLSELEVFQKTIYGEARGEIKDDQVWVAWVIKNRAHLNKDYWGGSTVKGVCLKPGMFECWTDFVNGGVKEDISIDDDPVAYDKIRSWAKKVYDAPANHDPTDGCDHYNNPDTDVVRDARGNTVFDENGRPKKPEWIKNVDKIIKIGNHQFYRTKK